jgi:hypothetical protein
MRNAYKIFESENLKETDHLRDLGTNGKIKLKEIE